MWENPLNSWPVEIVREKGNWGIFNKLDKCKILRRDKIYCPIVLLIRLFSKKTFIIQKGQSECLFFQK